MTTETVTAHDLKFASQALAALGHSTRLNVFRLLVRAGQGGIAIGDIGERLEIPLTTLHYHLKKLKAANLIHEHKELQTHYQIANYNLMQKLVDLLSAECCRDAQSCCQN